jgi:hypothetical protein
MYIDYEITGETLVFVGDDGSKKQVQKGTEEAEQLFEEVARNRDLAGLNGEEAKAAAEAKQQEAEDAADQPAPTEELTQTPAEDSQPAQTETTPEDSAPKQDSTSEDNSEPESPASSESTENPQ